MPIRASFSGSDGQSKAFDFEVPSSASRLADFLGAQTAPEEQRAPQHKPIDEEAGKTALKAGDQPDFLEKKIDAAGSIEAGLNGLRLKGDGEGTGGGFLNRVYAIVNGIRRWWSLRDIDPPIPGKLVGPAFGTNLLDADSASVGTDNDTAFSFLAVSRIATQVDDTASMETVYAFLREVQVSAGGRIIGVGPEQKQFIGNFLLGGGGDKCQYGVRAYFKEAVGTGILPGTQVLTHMAFGESADLKSLPDEYSTDPDEDWAFLRYPADKNGNPLFTIEQDGTVNRRVQIVPVMAAATFYGFEGKNTLVEDNY
jgi:hypothetical protein